MTARPPRIGLLLPLLALIGCVPEYNPQVIRSEADVLSDVVQLTRPSAVDGFDRAGGGRFSPDLRWVVFRGVPHTSHPTAGSLDYGLFVARVRWIGGAPGGGPAAAIDRPIRITRVGSRCGGACFSPDGFTLAFAAAPPQSKVMRLFRVDGWEQDVAMTDTARGVDLAQHAITPADLSADECDWSADGKSICFAATAADGGPFALYAVRPDGSHLVRLGPPSGFARGPVFSPGGDHLLYRGGPAPAASQVFVADPVYDVNGVLVALDHEHALTDEGTAAATGPAWLGIAGLHAVYATNRHGDPELYEMRNDGKLKTRLTFTPGPDLLPTASPDGRHLLWTSTRSADGSPQLFAAELRLPPGS